MHQMFHPAWVSQLGTAPCSLLTAMTSRGDVKAHNLTDAAKPGYAQAQILTTILAILA